MNLTGNFKKLLPSLVLEKQKGKCFSESLISTPLPETPIAGVIGPTAMVSLQKVWSLKLSIAAIIATGAGIHRCFVAEVLIAWVGCQESKLAYHHYCLLCTSEA